MSPEQFAYWLQGFAELTDGAQPTAEQWKSINEHLKTVFVKVTPQVGAPRVTGPVFAEPARYLTPIERFERGMTPFQVGHPLLVTC
jgi:hypothetical protein